MDYRKNLFSPLALGLYKAAAVLGQKHLFLRTYQLLVAPRADMAAFRNRHAGQRCFILGGGPSLLKLEPAPLRKEITFGANAVFLIFDWLGFQPTYYAVEDWFVYEDRQADIKEQVSESQCFFPIQFSSGSFDRENHHYFRALYEFDEHPGWPDFSKDASRLVWIGGTVTYVCLQLAYYMGCNPVYLVGMDHTYSRPDHVAVDGTSWTSQGDDPNHFHPDYFGKGKRWHDPRVDRMEKAYQRAESEFLKIGRKVFNATRGGRLEVFERVDYDTLF
jgi:hypothetical protein